ncbi:DUF4247 domain-containing protein [Actinopolyspora sp. H202]|uniref:DUF4247 domain-containing protein n=1 Tax=Actinopolyspora sp. H202 TaxID=1500456 RepID=UPI003EE445BB
MRPSGCFLFGGVTAVVALIVAIAMISSTGTGPRAYVAEHYTRAERLDKPDDEDNRAYTSDDSATDVVEDISLAWEPVSRYTDSSGVYLRYGEDAVMVRAREQGSVIHVMELDEAYEHYPHVVGGVWGWGGPHGQHFRGGGPGSGK